MHYTTAVSLEMSDEPYKRIIITFLQLLLFTISNAQSFSGQIFDQKNKPMQFVNVVLLDENDSTFVAGAVSADDGSFVINCNRQRGWIRISHLGYKTLCVFVRQGYVGKIQMDQEETSLDDVTVSASNITHKGDKDVIWITSTMRRGNYNIGEILGNVPGIYYNRGTKDLKYYGESNVVLLVDSVEKNANYIKRLHHVRFDRIEIIPYPKGKYDGYVAVINLHTRSDYEGYEGAFENETDFFPSNCKIGDQMFSDISGNGSLTYTRNKWNYFLNYNGNFDQSAKENLSEVEYPMNSYREEVIANKDHKKNKKEFERRHLLTGGADYQFNKRNSFSIAYRLGLQADDNYGLNTVVKTQQSLKDTVFSNYHGDNNGISHTVAAYFRGGLGKWNYTADFNLVLTDDDVCCLLQKTSGYINQDDRHNQMTHTLTRTEFNRRFYDDKLNLAVGYNNFWKQYRQTRLQTSDILTDYSLWQNKLWFYISGNISRNTSLNAAASLILNNMRSMGQKDDYLSYDASLGVYQKFTNDIWLRLNYKCGVSNPTINQITSYGQFVDSLQWVGGNPLLRSEITNNFDFRFQFCKWLSFITKYKYQPRTFSSITELREGDIEFGKNGCYAATTPQNSKYQNLWVGIYYWQKIKNFSFSADCYYRYVAGEYKNFRNSVGYWHGNLGTSYDCDAINLHASAYYNLCLNKDVWAQGVSKQQVDMLWLYVSKNFFREHLEFSLSYVLPVHFTSGDNYRYVTTPALVARYKDYSQNRLSDNNFTFNIVYRFLGGKSVREYKREMSNEK